MTYFIPESELEKINNLIADLNLPLSILDEDDDDEVIDFEEVVYYCDHDLNYPLFLEDKSEYFCKQATINMIPEMKKRLDALYEFINGEEWLIFDRSSMDNPLDAVLNWSDNTSATLSDLIVFSGYHAFSVLKDRAFSIDYAKYNFSSWSDAIFSLGAYYVNSVTTYDCRLEANHWLSHSKGRVFKNCLSGDIHGDFRFKQIDLTIEKNNKSPLGDSVKFIKPTSVRENYISAYHSVECQFLLIVIRYAQQVGAKSNILDDYEKFYTDFMGKNSSNLGPFGDAGLGSDYIPLHLLEYDIPKNGEPYAGKTNLYYLSQLHDSNEYALVDGNDLIFTHNEDFKTNDISKCVRFTPNDVDNIIYHLHLQCAKGMGRTSVENLFHTMARLTEHSLSA